MSQSLEPFPWRFCPACGAPLTPRHDGEKLRPHCEACRRFYYHNPLPAVCCFITQDNGLLLARRAVEPCRGEWSLPGGFVELGESTKEAAVREMHEETGLRVRGLRLIGASTQHSRHYGAVTVLGYVAQEWDGVPQPGSDVAEVRFFPKEQRPVLPFTTHRELVALFDALAGAA